MTDLPPRLTIIFRYLCLCYGDKAKGGVWFFLPSDGHRAKLRDVITGTEIPLFGARLRIGVAPRQGDGTTFTNTYKASTMEAILGVGQPVQIQAKYLADFGKLPDLCLQTFLPGGTITSYPPAGFPEMAGTRARIGGAKIEPVLTDTLVYTTNAEAGSLTISSEGREIRITGSGRFEITNDDERRERSEAEKTGKEIETLKKLLIPEPTFLKDPAFLSDDIWPCPNVPGGTFN